MKIKLNLNPNQRGIMTRAFDLQVESLGRLLTGENEEWSGWLANELEEMDDDEGLDKRVLYLIGVFKTLKEKPEEVFLLDEDYIEIMEHILINLFKKELETGDPDYYDLVTQFFERTPVGLLSKNNLN